MATLDVEKARLLGISEDEIQSYMKANNLTPKKTVSGFTQNIAESTIKTAKGIVQPLLTPVQTVKDLGNLAIGVAQLVIPGKQDKEKFAKALGQFYVDRYGSLQKAADTLYSDPVGVVADISTVIGGGAGVLKAGGQVSKIGGLTRAGQTLARLTPETLTIRGLGRVAPKGAMAKAGAKIEQFGKEYALRGIRPSQSSIKKFSEKFRTPMEDWVAKQGLTVDQLEELRNPAIPTSQNETIRPLYEARKSAIRKTGKNVSAEELQNAFRKRINELRSGADADLPQSQKLAQDLENYLQQYIGTTGPTILDPIIKEAQKYKKANEFLKAQGKRLYRGQEQPYFSLDSTREKFLPNMQGTSFSKKLERATNYGENIIEGYIPNSKILTSNDLPKNIVDAIKKEIRQLTYDDYVEGDAFEDIVSKLVKYAETEGKEAVDLTTFFPRNKIDAEVRILDTSTSFKTKPQLIEIYNQAKQIKPKTVRQRDVAENIPLSEIDDLRSKFDQATVQSEFNKSPDASFNRIMGDTLRKVVNEKAGTTDVGRKISQYETFAEIARKSPSGKGNIPLGLGTGVYMKGLEIVPLVGPVAGAAVREFINAPRTVQKVSQATQKIGRAMQGMGEKAAPAANVFRNTLRGGLEVGKAARMVTPTDLSMPTQEEKPMEKQMPSSIEILKKRQPLIKAPPQTKTPTTTNAFARVKKLRKGAFV